MRPEARKYLEDIRQAAEHVARFTKGKSLSDYTSDELLRSGVERKFEIIGEALNLLRKAAPEMAGRIGACQEIIAFRNRLAHGYSSVDDEIVWDVIESDLAPLLREVEALLREL